MKTFLLLVVMGVVGTTAYTQDKNNSLSVGIDVSAPVYTVIGSMKGVLTGVFIKKEWGLSKKLAATGSIGYSYFDGSIESFDDKVSDFAVIPILAGLKYYAWNNYYASLEVGAGIKAHQNGATKLPIVPAVGMMIPVAGKQLDLGIRFYTIKTGFGTPEAHLLNKGGYSFLGARLALVF